MLEPMLIIIRVLVKDKRGRTTTSGTERVFLDLLFSSLDVSGMSPPSAHLFIVFFNGEIQVRHN
jgi:hypothetical protein